ncbi:hypothetical protein KIN20_017630 [Parelaphostrongylus tenuis]|uniref:Saposin B-type domain-containing protein n=1 Tax=Parelaphostrongylus tenuis TaxID=148309 RepID=A0AAD5QRL7_PARTN|nr:hypothetical protein KIN20_017630 [Parelaphostrongylus tenuis]
MHCLCVISLSLVGIASAYFGWSDDSKDANFPSERSTSPSPSSSNMACFFCSQLLSVTKHRVGLSQNQLREVLYDKCRVLPLILKGQCFTFVETSLPEIYFSLNYDFSTKNICVRLNICDENSPFTVAIPVTEEYPSAMSTGTSTSEDEKYLESTTNADYLNRPKHDRIEMHRTPEESERNVLVVLSDI